MSPTATDLERKLAVEQLVTHPGWQVVCEEMQMAIEEEAVRLVEARTDEEILKAAHGWRATYRLFRVLRDTPLEVRRELEADRESGLLDYLPK